MQPIILSPYMDNVPARVRTAQASVVNLARGVIPFEQIRTTTSHGATLQRLTNEAEAAGFDTIVFLDIDCVPLGSGLLHSLQLAQRGALVGNVQRSNHIQNNEHLYAAPSFMAFSIEQYRAIGSPTFEPTQRGDVGEELTYAWERSSRPVQLWIPSRCDAPLWALSGNLPHYGHHTYYVNPNGQLASYHAFQSREGHTIDRFVQTCEQIVADSTKQIPSTS
jgi:hypothetical protein